MGNEGERAEVGRKREMKREGEGSGVEEVREMGEREEWERKRREG